jgi:hypothetical protein
MTRRNLANARRCNTSSIHIDSGILWFALSTQIFSAISDFGTTDARAVVFSRPVVIDRMLCYFLVALSNLDSNVVKAKKSKYLAAHLVFL